MTQLQSTLGRSRETQPKAKTKKGKYWYKFSRNKLSVLGLVIVVTVVLLALLAPWITPYPRHVRPFVDFANASKAPSAKNLLGTDIYGRDILTRIIFAFRGALLTALVVLSLSVPVGVLLGLLAGYFRGSWIDTVIMRTTDVFLAVPPLILALAIASVLKPNLMNSMLAVAVVHKDCLRHGLLGQERVLCHRGGVNRGFPGSYYVQGNTSQLPVSCVYQGSAGCGLGYSDFRFLKLCRPWRAAAYPGIGADGVRRGKIHASVLVDDSFPGACDYPHHPWIQSHRRWSQRHAGNERGVI